MAKPFFSRRLPFLGSYAMLILCVVFFLLPFGLRGARMAINAMQNNVADWLPSHYPETQDLQEFRKYFVGDSFVVVSGPWCKEGNQVFDNFKNKLVEESLAYEKVLEKTQNFEELRAHRLGDELGLMFAGNYHKDWGQQQEKWLLGRKGQWYWINRKGELWRWDGQNNVIEGGKRSFERMIHGKNKALGKLITIFGEEPDEQNQYTNAFYADPQKLCARPFKSITSGPDIFEKMAGPDGTLRIRRDASEDDAEAFEAQLEAHKRLTGAMFGPTPSRSFTWTFESLLRHVEPERTAQLKEDQIHRQRFEEFIRLTLKEKYNDQLSNLNNAKQDDKLEAWYGMWTALEMEAPPRQTCLIVTLNEPVVHELDRAVGRPLLGKARGRILEIATGECGIAPENLHLGGPPVDNVAIDEEGTSTLLRLVSLAGLIGIVLAYLSFRSIKVTGMLFFVGGVAAVTSLSYVWFAGTTMDAILMSMPSLVYVLGLSGAVHVVNYYRDACRENGEEGAVETAVMHGLFPCTLAAFTTALGLISLYSSNLTPIKKFGLFSAIAVMATVILLFTYLPAALTVFSPGYKKREPAQPGDEPERGLTAMVGRFWDAVGSWVIRRSSLVMIVTVVLMGYFAYGVSKIETSVHLLKLFDPNAKILSDYRWMEDNLGELVPAEVVVMFDEQSQRKLMLDDAEIPVDQTDFDYYQHALKYSMLERIELSHRVRTQLEKFFGPNGLKIVGSGMSTDVFVPLQRVGTQVELDGVGTRKLFNTQLEKKRQDMLDEDYMAVATEENSGPDYKVDKLGREMWRISIRLAALSDVDYGQFIGDLKAVVEPVMTAYEFRGNILQSLKHPDKQALIPDGQILVLGPEPDRQEVLPRLVAGQAISQSIDQTYIFSDTLQDLLENRGFTRFTSKNKPERKLDDGSVVRRKGYYWLDPMALVKDLPDDKVAAIKKSLETQIANTDCVVLITENNFFDTEYIQANAKNFVDCRRHKYEIDPETNTPRTGVQTALEKQDSGQNVNVTAMYTGIIPIVYKAQRSLLYSLRDSIGLAFIMIALVMMLLLRNWRAPVGPDNLLNVRGGMLSMLPNVFPVVLIFGAMGHMGRLVDIGSMMTASVAMGVAVDDTIHFLNWYRQGLGKGLRRHDAIRLAYSRVATAMTHTTLIGGLGLSAFALSTFTPTQRFGVLMLFLLAAALIGDLILLPAILASPLGKYFGKENVDPTVDVEALIGGQPELRVVGTYGTQSTSQRQLASEAPEVHPDSFKHLKPPDEAM